MRAATREHYGPVEAVHLTEQPTPTPARGEVLVRVHAAGVDAGAYHLAVGRPYLLRLFGFGFLRPKDPVLGLDLAGTVEALGPGVTAFAVGDRVFGVGRGSFAELARARVDKLAKLPAGLGFEAAAAVPISGMTALQAVRDKAKVEAGQRVMIIGAGGGVGSFAVQLVRARGASVTAVASASKHALLRELGADRVLDYQREDLATAGLHDAILDLAGNRPLRELRRLLSPRGTLVMVGAGLARGSQGVLGGLQRQLGAMFVAPFSRQRLVGLVSAERGSDLEALAALLEAGTLRPAVDRVYPLAEASQALADLYAGRVRGKAVLAVP